MRAYRPCAWWIEITASEEHAEGFNLTRVALPDSRKRDERGRGGRARRRGASFFLVIYLFIFARCRLFFEHIWAHLFPHRESPVQLTQTISCETKASAVGVLLLLSSQVESQQPHFLSFPPPLCSHLYAPGFVLLSHLNLQPRNHLHYLASPSSPPSWQFSQLPRPG